MVYIVYCDLLIVFLLNGSSIHFYRLRPTLIVMVKKNQLYLISGLLLFAVFLVQFLSNYVSALQNSPFLYNWFDTVWRSVNFVNMFFWLSGYEFFVYLAVAVYFFWLVWKKKSANNPINISAWFLGSHALLSVFLIPLLSAQEGIYFLLILLSTLLQIMGFLCLIGGLAWLFRKEYK